jgi:hypothetical protein
MSGGRLLRRPAALIVFVILVIGSIAASAQQSDVLDALNQQVDQLSRAGKYAEASDIAKRALSLAERKFDSAHPTVSTLLNTLAVL